MASRALFPPPDPSWRVSTTLIGGYCLSLSLFGLVMVVHPTWWQASAWSRALFAPLSASTGSWPRMFGLQIAMMGLYLGVLLRCMDAQTLRWALAGRALLLFGALGLWMYTQAVGLLVLAAIETLWCLLGLASLRKLDASKPSVCAMPSPSALHQIGLGIFPIVEGLACFLCLDLWSSLAFATQAPNPDAWAKIFALQSCYLGAFWFLMLRHNRQEVIFATLIGRFLVACAFATFVLTGIVPSSSRYLLLATMLTLSSIWTWLELSDHLHLDSRLL